MIDIFVCHAWINWQGYAAIKVVLGTTGIAQAGIPRFSGNKDEDARG